MPKKLQPNKRGNSRIAKVEEYLRLKEASKAMAKRMEVLNKEIKLILAEKGEDTARGDKGLLFKTSYGDRLLVNTKKQSYKIAEDAIETIQKYLPEYASKLIGKMEYVNQDKLEALLELSKIPKRVQLKLFTIAESYALTISENKPNDEDYEEQERY